MDQPASDAALSPDLKFATGQPVSRKEDPRLLTGGGCYSDDAGLPNQAHAAVLRAQIAHGRLQGIDCTQALALPGVLAIYTAADMASAGYGTQRCGMPLKNADGSPLIAPPRPILAVDRVRHVGEALALVVAETEAIALDALDLLTPDIEPLPAVVDPERALGDDAPRLYDAHDNLCLDWRYGDFAAVEEAFAAASHVTRVRLLNNRLVAAPLEPRAALASYDSTSERYSLRVGCQGVFPMRQTIATLMNLEPERIRVLSDDIGGSFGMKAACYNEYVPLLHAARELGRPVKWCGPRSESFLSDQQGRATIIEAALALDAEGNILAARVDHLGDMGAYLTGFGPAMPSVNMQKNLPSLYRTPLVAISCRCVFTNSVPIGPYRGAGRPEGCFTIERLLDQAARETGHDQAELRRRNMIPADAMPFKAASGLTYDSGDFEALLDAGLARADWDGYAARRAESAARGRIRGRGLACYLEVTAPPSKEMGALRFEADGRVSLITGTLDYGQGHASAFAQVVAERLGLPFEALDLVQGDSDELLAGGGTGGSRSIMASGKALAEAADAVIEKGRAWSAHVLEAAEADIEFQAAPHGHFRIVGTDRSIGLLELAQQARDGQDRPESLPESLDSSLVAEGVPSAFPNGCHVAEVEIDPETGRLSLERYAAVDDFGTLINPLLVEGQVHGGVTQGIGQALMEQTLYDDDGQLITGSFMDYALPRADDLPAFEVGFHPVPATSNPLGVKGCGEAGVTAALPAVVNAVADALASQGAPPVDMPATAESLWRALRQRKAA